MCSRYVSVAALEGAGADAKIARAVNSTEGYLQASDL